MINPRTMAKAAAYADIATQSANLQQQQAQTRGVSGGGGRSDNGDSGSHVDVADAVAPVTATVIGSSAVDYYA
mgnify:CR=1 FL=1